VLIPPPPTLASLPRGTQLVAGLGYATVLPDLDCETYSEAGFIWNDAQQKWDAPPGCSPQNRGLPAVGAAVYTEHPTCVVLTLSYDLKDGRGKRRWRPGMPNPQELFDYIAAGGLIESHNCGFEFWVWLNVLHARYGWPLIPHHQQRCSMAKARAHGLPGGLDPLSNVLDLTHKKDPEGKRLLDKFSKPQKPTKRDPRTRILPEQEPIEAERLYRYCDRDIEAEGEASSMIPDLSPHELEWWMIDQLINRRGVAIDTQTVRAGISVIEQAFTRYNAELRELTGGTVQQASELQKLSGWLGAQGVRMYSMTDEAVEEKLKELDDSVTGGANHSEEIAHVYRALEIRQLVGSASVKKLYAMNNQATQAGRLHELFSYHAARTGRATGNGPQPTNLPNSGPDMNVCVCGRHYGLRKTACPWCGAPKPPAPPAPLPNKSVVEWCAEAAADAIEIIRTGSLDAVEYYFDHALDIVSGCLRGLFVSSPGYDFISSDYSAIEAVVLAELAGEQWRIDLFQQGGKIYEASGAKIQGITYDEAIEYKKRTGNHHPCRKKGKVAELACGYGGWIGAFRNFGADEFMTEEEMKDTILAWRNASPMIVEFWGGQQRGRGWNARPEFYGLEGMAIQAVMYPGNEFTYRGISYLVRGDVLYCRLLSGRYLAYHRPRLRPSERGGLALSYEGWNTNPKNGPTGWIRMDTYGGKLTENVVQATARDILVHAIVKLWGMGYLTVLHVYDEIVAEVPHGWGSVEEFERVMSEMPTWAHGWPVRAAGGWRGHRYRK
jgi:DNA polymerase